MAKAAGASKPAAPPCPAIAVPPRASMEALFAGGTGLSPGPMTLVSNFFSEQYPDTGCGSFSQLLAGAMASPLAGLGSPNLSFFGGNSSKEGGSGNGGERQLGFEQNLPANLVVAHSPLFMVPPGLSPSGLLNSPSFFSPCQSPFGMTHQQALAQVTAQAALSESYMSIQPEHQNPALAASVESFLLPHQSFVLDTAAEQEMHSAVSEPESSMMESSEVSQSDRKSLPPIAIDKPANDGYNWRKYGQKQVKASECPRSYYRCTHLNCPVKKKVERNFDGQITEITYRGQHNHELPQSNKHVKDGIYAGLNSRSQARSEPGSLDQIETSKSNGTSHTTHGTASVSAPLTGAQVHGSSDNEAMCDAEMQLDEGDDEPNPKRRSIDGGASDLISSQKTVTESRIIVQTRSEVDLLDDGYKWRKYGQKVVKGNSYPRSYYKCTYPGCNVRKHVERASSDPKAVVTTYEGKHNHDVPAARNGGYITATDHSAMQLKVHKAVAKKPVLLKELVMGNNELQLKDEQITA